MTKPLPIGSIKSMKKIPNLCKVNIIIEDFLSTIIFLFSKCKQKKSYFQRNIHTNIWKKESISATDQSVFQLLDAMRLEGTLNSCKTTAKTHSTMKQKRFLPLYAEYLHFLTKNATGL